MSVPTTLYRAKAMKIPPTMAMLPATCVAAAAFVETALGAVGVLLVGVGVVWVDEVTLVKVVEEISVGETVELALELEVETTVLVEEGTVDVDVLVAVLEGVEDVLIAVLEGVEDVLIAVLEGVEDV
jgi:hypothetical protein